MNVMKVEKVSKYELKSWEVEAIDIFAEDLKDAARRYISKNIVLAC